MNAEFIFDIRIFNLFFDDLVLFSNWKKRVSENMVLNIQPGLSINIV